MNNINNMKNIKNIKNIIMDKLKNNYIIDNNYQYTITKTKKLIKKFIMKIRIKYGDIDDYTFINTGLKFVRKHLFTTYEIIEFIYFVVNKNRQNGEEEYEEFNENDILYDKIIEIWESENNKLNDICEYCNVELYILCDICKSKLKKLNVKIAKKCMELITDIKTHEILEYPDLDFDKNEMIII